MKRIYSLTILCCILTFMASSCLKDDTDELIAAHDQAFAKMKADYGLTEADLIGDGIYMHISDSGTKANYPAPGYYIVVDLAGFDSNGGLFDVTDASTADANHVLRPDLVYGPIRININQTFVGFYKAIQKMPQGAEAVMLFPYDQAFGSYEPVVYEVKLYRVISDYPAYLDHEFITYMNLLGINPTNNLDLINADSAYQSRRVQGNTLPHPELEIGDSAQIFLHAHYVETDPTYVNDFPGRCFFPINDSGDSIWFEVGENNFPITGIINSLVCSMDVGDSLDIITPSIYTYGSEGFVHPYTGIYIVPPDISIHYTIELLDYRKY